MSDVKLSILILTIPSRADKLERLMKILRQQIPVDGSVELITKENRAIPEGGPTIGENRNAALADAIGDYVCFIDDDDVVCDTYIAEIIKATASCPDVVGLKGHYILGGNKPELFVHSIQYTEWKTVDGVHQRCPNHLNAVKRELALQVGFTPKNHGEDCDYSMALRPLLKTEVMPEPILYFYLKT